MTLEQCRRRALRSLSTLHRHVGFKRSISSRLLPATSAQLLAVLQQNFELSEEDAKNELRWIVEEVRNPLRGGKLDSSESKNEEVISNLVERRAAGEPLQYILDFGPLTLKCRAPTLIPRPETAWVFERYANLLRTAWSSEGRESAKGKKKVLDLCTGSGCIPLLLAHMIPDLPWPIGMDISTDAISLAQENATLLGTPLNLIHADLFDPNFARSLIGNKHGKVDILVSNPPYIPLGEYERLPRGVKEYEDPRALLADDAAGDGLSFYRRIAELIPLLLRSAAPQDPWMKEVPRVVLEIGHHQARDVREILSDGSGERVTKTEVWKDQYDNDRAIAAWVS